MNLINITFNILIFLTVTLIFILFLEGFMIYRIAKYLKSKNKKEFEKTGLSNWPLWANFFRFNKWLKGYQTKDKIFLKYRRQIYNIRNVLILNVILIILIFILSNYLNK